MNCNFAGKVAFVTGGASGIGFATAKAFSEAGASVLIADVNHDAAQRSASELSREGAKAIGVGCDVSDERQVAEAVERAVSSFGRLDMACNSAGLHVPVSETADAKGDDFDFATSVNLRGIWNCMKHQLVQMRKQGSGAIVNISSQSGVVGTAGLGAYTASKHGVVGLTKSAALEYAAKGIRINVVCPGSVDTPMVQRALADEPETMKAVMKEIPLGRLGRPEEIASAVLWLCSPGAAFVIGHALVVDGGYTAR